jgi:hypothetical protein
MRIWHPWRRLMDERADLEGQLAEARAEAVAQQSRIVELGKGNAKLGMLNRQLAGENERLTFAVGVNVVRTTNATVLSPEASRAEREMRSAERAAAINHGRRIERRAWQRHLREWAAELNGEGPGDRARHKIVIAIADLMAGGFVPPEVDE